MRVPHRKTYKNDRYDVIKQKFEKMKKVSSQIFVKIICVHFHQNRTKIVEIKDPDRHTHTHTDTHTHTHAHTDRDRPGTTYSVLK